MQEAAIDCQIIPSPADEIHDASLTPPALTEHNARAKAEAISALHPQSTVIGADTLVFIDGEPLGKPRDMAEAEAMLLRLVGRTHQVCTGVCLCRAEPAKCVTFHAITDVTFHALTLPEIHAYHAKIEPLDKAGAYAAQDHGKEIIRETSGSWSNIVGLPMDELRAQLTEF
ncbi:MAG: septum formation protein [Verrucomicrobiales bacterium]|jgi:septum formation protein